MVANRKTGGEPGEDGTIHNIGTILQKAPVSISDALWNVCIMNSYELSNEFMLYKSHKLAHVVENKI